MLGAITTMVSGCGDQIENHATYYRRGCDAICVVSLPLPGVTKAQQAETLT